MTYQPQPGDVAFTAVSSSGQSTLTTGYLTAGGTYMPTAPNLMAGENPAGEPTVVSTDNNGNVNVNVLPGGIISDANSAAFGGAALFAASGANLTAAVGRSLGYVCTSSGTLTVTFPDGSTITVPVNASQEFQSLPFATSEISLSAGAAGTFWSMK